MSHCDHYGIGYLDLPSGISGDIFLGCLVDAGWPLVELKSVIERLSLPPGSCSVTQQSVRRGALQATLVNVNSHQALQHRNLRMIESIIEDADLPTSVKEQAIAVFRRLAHVESSVHGTRVEDVHFHEVGAVDAIVDIVGVCAGLEMLGIEALYASPLPLGEGWTVSAHGRIPLPAPATLALLAGVEAPTRSAPGPGELVTPTGAALVAELAEFRQPAMRVRRIGLGAGRKEFSWPNIARLWLGDSDDRQDGRQEDFVQIETNLDDMNPELVAAVTQRLFASGAVDVWMTPIQMKKGRPAVILSVLAPASRETELATALLRETTTLGVRVHRCHRHEAERRMGTVNTEYGTVRVKLKWVQGELLGVKAEYDDCLQLAEAHGAPVRVVHEAAQAAAYMRFRHGSNSTNASTGGNQLAT